MKLEQAKSVELLGGMKREHMAGCERERCGRRALKRAGSKQEERDLRLTLEDHLH